MNLQFIIGGAQKAGSTYIHAMCNQHPDIFIPEGEVTILEDNKTEATVLSAFNRLLDSKRVTVVDENIVFGIKRPNLLCNEEALKQVKYISSDVKLIFILRNPIQRAVSSYFHQVRNGVIPTMDFDTGISKILSGTLKDYPRGKEVIEFGRYGYYLEKHIETFGKENVHIVLYDDIRKDKATVIKKLYNFLGVKDFQIDEETMNARHNSSLYIKPSFEPILKVRNFFMFTYNKDRTRISKKSMASRAIGRVVERIFLTPFNKVKPKISDAAKQKLFTAYKDDIHLLEKILDRKLTNWYL